MSQQDTVSSGARRVPVWVWVLIAAMIALLLWIFLRSDNGQNDPNSSAGQPAVSEQITEEGPTYAVDSQPATDNTQETPGDLNSVEYFSYESGKSEEMIVAEAVREVGLLHDELRGLADDYCPIRQFHDDEARQSHPSEHRLAEMMATRYRTQQAHLSELTRALNLSDHPDARGYPQVTLPTFEEITEGVCGDS